MKINHDLRHRVTVVEAQGKALIEQKVELEADLQTKEQEMGSLRAELGRLRERLQGERGQDQKEEPEVSLGERDCGPGWHWEAQRKEATGPRTQRGWLWNPSPPAVRPRVHSSVSDGSWHLPLMPACRVAECAWACTGTQRASWSSCGPRWYHMTLCAPAVLPTEAVHGIHLISQTHAQGGTAPRRPRWECHLSTRMNRMGEAGRLASVTARRDGNVLDLDSSDAVLMALSGPKLMELDTWKGRFLSIQIYKRSSWCQRRGTEARVHCCRRSRGEKPSPGSGAT